MKSDDMKGFELIDDLSGKSDFWVCGKRNRGDFSAVRVYMRKRPPLLAPARSVAAEEDENEWRSDFPCNAVRSPFYKVNSSLITGIVLCVFVPLFGIAAFLLELKVPTSKIPWSLILFISSICATMCFFDSFFSNLPQMMEFSRDGVSFFVNGRLSRKISAAALRQIYFVESAFMKGGVAFDAFRLIAVVEELGGFGAGRLSSLTLLENVPFYEAALFLEEESERMMGLQDVPMVGEARQRGYSSASGSLDSASVCLSSLPLSLGSLEKEGTVASISGTGDEERLEVRSRIRPLGPWSDFVGWNCGKFFEYALIFPPVFLVLFPVAALLNRTDLSILFRKDSVVVSCARPYFEKVIRRDEISRIYFRVYTIKSTPLYDVCLLDSVAGTRSLVSGMRSFETAKFIESNAGRIMGIVDQGGEGEV